MIDPPCSNNSLTAFPWSFFLETGFVMLSSHSLKLHGIQRFALSYTAAPFPAVSFSGIIVYIQTELMTGLPYVLMHMLSLQHPPLRTKPPSPVCPVRGPSLFSPVMHQVNLVIST